MPPLCNYNNNHDDDFANEYAIHGAYTQLLFLVSLLYCDQLLWSGLLKNRETFFY